MNVKVITTALNCLIGSVALTFVNDNQSLELATKAAVSRHGREAIVMYQCINFIYFYDAIYKSKFHSTNLKYGN